MLPFVDWLLRIGADGGARNAGRSLAERRHAQRAVDALAERLPGLRAGDRPAV